MPDEIRRLSEALARAPSGTAWIGLADALRRTGRLADAERTALRGLERQPYSAEGHDVLARIAADGGDRERARDEWEMVLCLAPGHVGASLGLSFLAWQAGDASAAMRWWELARDAAPDDPRVAAVGRQLDHTVRSAAAPSRPGDALFAPVEESGATGALLIDADGLVLLGRAPDATGRDVAETLAAELSGLCGEAGLALRQLQLGAWERMQVECDDVTFALAPAPDDTLVLVTTASARPPGLPRLLLQRAHRRAAAWLEGT